MCFSRQKSSSAESTKTTQIDKRTAAQDSGIAVATNGNVVVDQVPEELLNFASGVASGPADLVKGSLSLVNEKVDKVLALSPQAVDASTRAKPKNPVALVAIMVIAYVNFARQQ